MSDDQRDDPALLDALISSYSVLSLLHHRGATVDQSTRRNWRGKLIRTLAHGKLTGFDAMDVEAAMNKLEPFAKAAEHITRSTG